MGKYKVYILSLALAFMAIILIFTSSTKAEQPLWREFAHPASPHLASTNPNIPLSIPKLLDITNPNAIVRLPMLVVLLDFDDQAAQAVNTHARYDAMVFGTGVDGLPSVADLIRENSNGRLLIEAAKTGDNMDGNPDGIVGWATAQTEAGCCRDPSTPNNDPVKLMLNSCLNRGNNWTAGSFAYYSCWIQEKRAEGIRQADGLFDYSEYDNNNDNLITSDELVVVVINADPTYGGNTRRTSPSLVAVEAGQKDVHQHVVGVTESTDFSLIAHEISHAALGHGDLYENCTPPIHISGTDKYYCNTPSEWWWATPSWYSIMYRNPFTFRSHFDPWGKIHLGFVKPLVVTHDGTYTLFDVETERSIPLQTTQPEALIIYDPLKPDPYTEYFIIENRDRNVPGLDRGLAVWQINENYEPTNWRKFIRLIRRGGNWASNNQALWDGGNDTDGYDLSATSTPRNTDWTDGQKSYVEIYDISPAGPSMTFKVRMPPIFVDTNTIQYPDGSQTNPYKTLDRGINAIPEHPRTIKIAGGSYPEPMVINEPVTLIGWRNGNAILGQ